MAEENKDQKTIAELLKVERELEKEACASGPGVQVEKHVSVNQDYIVLGAPTSGQIKVYGDATRPQTWASKIEMTQKILADAREREAEAKAVAKNGQQSLKKEGA